LVKAGEGEGSGAMGGNYKRNWRGKIGGKGNSRHSRARENLEKNRSEELALAVSIIMANLSCDEDFLYLLLGVEDWKPIKQADADQLQADDGPATGNKVLSIKDDDGEGEGDAKDGTDFREIFEKKMETQKAKLIGQDTNSSPTRTGRKKQQSKPEGNYGNYDDQQLKTLTEVERVTRLFNLLSHDNIYISEQISILLANVSNSSYFRHIFVTDRCMKSLLKILRDQSNDQVARVSQLASLIVVLNLTSLNDIVVGMENMKFM
jgi:hypothetical protein